MNLLKNKPPFLHYFKLDRSDFEWLCEFPLPLFNLQSIKYKHLFQAVFILMCASVALFFYFLFHFEQFQVVLCILMVLLTALVFVWLLKSSVKKINSGEKR